MTNDECLMTNQKASPNDEGGGAGRSGFPFVIVVCRLIRHSAFDIRHWTAPPPRPYCPASSAGGSASKSSGTSTRYTFP
jgi:hypothetical protein